MTLSQWPLRMAGAALLSGAVFGSAFHTAAADHAFARKGPVRVDGQALRDDGGVFNPMGASLFWLAWAVKFDRPRLESNLRTLADAGFEYVRAFGVVGPAGGWADREVDPRWPDYARVIADATDVAYDRFGLRVQWTIFGGVDRVPAPGARAAVVDRFIELARGREHKILLFEIANEGWQTGFSGASGRDELRALGRRLNDATSVPVALTAPEGGLSGVCALYGGASADLMTWHHDRSRQGAVGAWQPIVAPLRIRRALTAQRCDDLPAAIANNEPIGPGSSLEEERDPARLAIAYVFTFAARHASFVLHTGPGIRGGGAADRERGRWGNVGELPEWPAIARALAAAREVTPAGLANWIPIDLADREAPLQGLADAVARGDLVDASLSRQGGEVFGALAGLRRAITLRVAAPLTIEVIDPASGEVRRRQESAAGSTLTLTPRLREDGEGLVIRARSSARETGGSP